MRTLLTILSTFILTTLFWFSVPTFRSVVASHHDEEVRPEPETAHDEPLVILQADPKISEYEQQIKSYEKRIKNLESQLSAANSSKPANSTESAASTTANTPASEVQPKESAPNIIGTWAYADPQTSEERKYQLIFNAYGTFKYYNTSSDFTLLDYNYSISGNTLKIGYNTGQFRVFRENGVDYLEISGIKDYAGKLRRVR